MVRAQFSLVLIGGSNCLSFVKSQLKVCVCRSLEKPSLTPLEFPFSTETDGDKMTFVPLLDGMESNSAFLRTYTGSNQLSKF